MIGVTNRGRGEGTITDIYLNVPGPHSIMLHQPDNLRGPKLPCRLPANASPLAWTVDAAWLLQEARRNGWPHQVRAVVLPGGNQVWESIHRYTNLLSG